MTLDIAPVTVLPVESQINSNSKIVHFHPRHCSSNDPATKKIITIVTCRRRRQAQLKFSKLSKMNKILLLLIIVSGFLVIFYANSELFSRKSLFAIFQTSSKEDVEQNVYEKAEAIPLLQTNLTMRITNRSAMLVSQLKSLKILL